MHNFIAQGDFLGNEVTLAPAVLSDAMFFAVLTTPFLGLRIKKGPQYSRIAEIILKSRHG